MVSAWGTIQFFFKGLATFLALSKSISESLCFGGKWRLFSHLFLWLGPVPPFGYGAKFGQNQGFKNVRLTG